MTERFVSLENERNQFSFFGATNRIGFTFPSKIFEASPTIAKHLMYMRENEICLPYDLIGEEKLNRKKKPIATKMAKVQSGLLLYL